MAFFLQRWPLFYEERKLVYHIVEEDLEGVAVGKLSPRIGSRRLP
jgi:hypothetical protein